MRRKLCTCALSGLLILGFAGGSLFAQDNTTPPPQNPPMHMRGHHRMNPERQLRHMTNMLDLSADQQSRMKPILEARQKEMQSVWQDQSLTRQDRHEKMMAIQQNYSSRIEAVLNNTQKQKYEAMQARMRERMKQRRMGQGMGQGMGPGMGPGNAPPPDNTSQPPQ